MTDKILYIGNDVSEINCGADAVNKINIDFLRKSFCGNVTVLPLVKNSISEKLKGYIGGLNPQLEKEILILLNSGDYQYIFLSNSLLGKLAKTVKKKFPNIKIIVFYHNIEIHYAKELIKTHGFKHYFFYKNARSNEKLATKYSDIRITLNSRDSKLMEHFYHIKPTDILPVSYKDKFDSNKLILSPQKVNTYLFVGTSFFANIDGIRWFIKNVMPKVDGQLIIVGNGMENYKDEFTSKMVKVYGYVNDLAEYYYKSSFVIAPIFVGGGMKTKIAEATMYGKTILGTKEAFEGYEKKTQVLLECNTSDEFINTINSIDNDKLMFNKESRYYYLKNHSDQAAFLNFQNILIK